MDILDILSTIRSRHRTMTETTKNTTQTTNRLDNSAEKKPTVILGARDFIRHPPSCS